ncbi:MAG: hypothetical protein IJ048_10140 [Clostridia bacterium]|nr:hypothetical protein [Clostridia bacterium]
MKKLSMLLALILALSAIPALAEGDELVYGTASLTYAEFYAGDVSSVESFDAVTSATSGKSSTLKNSYTDFVDAETNKGGYHILGVTNVNVAVAKADLEAYKAINETFVESDEIPAQYKTVTIEDGKAVYSATNFNIAATVADAQIEVVTDSHWGDYQVNITETSTANLRNGREDAGFPVNSTLLGTIVETESGLKVGMEYLQSIWVQPWEISWNVSVNNAGNPEMTYDNLAELDKLMGETITRVLFINADDVYEYTFEGAYLPVMFETSLTVENADYTAGTTAFAATNLPEDYDADYAVRGLEITAADGALTFDGALPGSYTLTQTDKSGKYAPKSTSFTLTTDILPVAYDAVERKLVPAEGADEALAEAFVKNLSKVTVNDTAYAASGRGAVAIIDSDGVVDVEAAVTEGRGADAVITPIFGEAGTYALTVEATGFDQAISFDVEIAD